MAKYKYITEYEINASVKMLFPYFATPAGLAQWFAEEVKVISNPEKLYDIVWDGVSHRAKISSIRLNSYVKYQFVDSDENGNDYSYLEFKMMQNDITNTTFVKVIDYSEMDNEHDLRELWNNLMASLREIVGA
jgi:uncharacterized protein YndB with AHSA1/START domain